MTAGRIVSWITAALTILLLVSAHPLSAESPGDRAYIRSLPFAVSEEQVYKVRIERIDGQDVSDALRYPLSEGRHEIELSLVLQVDWETPDAARVGLAAHRILEIDVHSGRVYELAGKVDIDASEDQVASGRFWTPLVYRTLDGP